MKRKQAAKIFPLRVFGLTFLVLALLTTVQMLILGRYVDYRNIAIGYIAVVILYWLLASAGFTLLIAHQINVRLEQPMIRFAQATEKVAGGDFSVYVKPLHSADKMNYMDYMFLDFNTMVEQLGSIETLKTDFFSNVSHEIKTPISVIQSYAEMLQKPDLPESKRREYSATILSSSAQLSELITNLLKLTKLEKQAISTMPEPYDVCRQLSESILSFESAWEQKEISIEASIEDSAFILADESLMALVWSNLLSNAVKFTPCGGQINIRQEFSSDRITVTISDSGCGIDAQALPHIFEKFYQADTSHSVSGNGLGLALVKRILQLMNCEISVVSKPGVGSDFTVTIPILAGGDGDE